MQISIQYLIIYGTERNFISYRHLSKAVLVAYECVKQYDSRLISNWPCYEGSYEGIKPLAFALTCIDHNRY